MKRFVAMMVFIAAAVLSGPVFAQGISAVVSPPRIETEAKPGDTYRDVIEIANAGSLPNQLSIKTADWTLDPNGGPVFTDSLAPDSCRPWVAIERRELTIAANGKYRFRFEVSVPKDAPPRECRFAIMIEGAAQKVDASGINLPVSGRIGVIVYLGVGDVASALTLVGYGTQTLNGTKLPSLKVRNSGSAHGRLAGFVDATDVNGKVFTMAPTTLPILPGEEREIALTFQDGKEGKKAPELPHYPITVRGKVYDGRNPLEVNTTFRP